MRDKGAVQVVQRRGCTSLRGMPYSAASYPAPRIANAFKDGWVGAWAAARNVEIAWLERPDIGTQAVKPGY